MKFDPRDFYRDGRKYVGESDGMLIPTLNLGPGSQEGGESYAGYDDNDLLAIYVPDGPVLTEYYHSRKYSNFIRGPLGSGKTIATAHAIRDCIMDIPPTKRGVRESKWMAVRNTFADLERTTIPDFQAAVPVSMGKFNASKLIQYMDFEGEDGIPIKSEMHFVAFDLEGSLKKFRGFQATGMWFNEIKELSQLIYNYGVSRTGREPRKIDMPIDPATGKPTKYWYGCFGDTNSYDDDHYMAKLEEKFDNGELDKTAFFVQPGGVTRVDDTDDFIINPDAENLINLDEDYYATQIETAPKDFIAVNLANEVGETVDGRLVHPEYKDAIHSPKDLKIEYMPGIPIVLGADFGRTPCSPIAQERYGGYVIFDEYVTDNMAVTTFARKLKKYLMDNYQIRVGHEYVPVWCDPAGVNKDQSSEQTMIEILISEGFDAMPAPVDNRDVTARRKALTDPLTRMRSDGKPACLVARKCEYLRGSLKREWTHKKMQVSGTERFQEEPNKAHPWSDIGEATEYLMLGCGEGVVYSPKSGATIKRAPSSVTRV